MRWRRKLVSRGSPEMVVRRLPISLKKTTHPRLLGPGSQGLDCDGNEIISLPHSCVFWDLAEWGFFGSDATDSECTWQVGIGYGFRNSDIPGDWSSTMPWNQCVAFNPFVAAISGQSPWFFLWGDLRLGRGKRCRWWHHVLVSGQDLDGTTTHGCPLGQLWDHRGSHVLRSYVGLP